MKKRNATARAVPLKLQLKGFTLCLLVFCGALSGLAQPADNPPRREDRPNFDGPSPFGPGGPSRGGFGGMMRQKTILVDQFDKDGDKRLNAAERKAAREFLQKE